VVIEADLNPFWRNPRGRRPIWDWAKPVTVAASPCAKLPIGEPDYLGVGMHLKNSTPAIDDF